MGTDDDDGETAAIRLMLQSVLRLQLAERRVEAAIAVEHGLAQSDVLALALLTRSAGRPIGELASDLHLSPGSTSTLVRRLELSGLVERSPNPLDRRSVLIAATPRGVAAVGAVRDRYAEALDAAGRAAGVDALRTAAAVVDHAAQHLTARTVAES